MIFLRSSLRRSALQWNVDAVIQIRIHRIWNEGFPSFHDFCWWEIADRRDIVLRVLQAGDTG